MCDTISLPIACTLGAEDEILAEAGDILQTGDPYGSDDSGEQQYVSTFD